MHRPAGLEACLFGYSLFAVDGDSSDFVKFCKRNSHISFSGDRVSKSVNVHVHFRNDIEIPPAAVVMDEGSYYTPEGAYYEIKPHYAFCANISSGQLTLMMDSKGGNELAFHIIFIFEDFRSLENLFKEHCFDAVIHLAAGAGVRYSMENPYVYVSTNVTGTLNLLELVKKYQVSKLVMASTSSLYAGQKMPFIEDLPVNTPISPYAASKKAAEMLCYSYHHLYGIDVSIVRYFTVYGPAGRRDMCIFRFIKWIDNGQPLVLFGDGNQARDFTYVDDIAKGTIRATKMVGYEVINLGGGQAPTNLRETIQQIEKHLGRKAIIEQQPFNKADIQETRADISKAARLLDWSPVVPFSDGLKRCMDCHVENRHWVNNIIL